MVEGIERGFLLGRFLVKDLKEVRCVNVFFEMN